MNDLNLLKQIEQFIDDLIKMTFLYVDLFIEIIFNPKRIYTFVTEEYQKEKKFEHTIFPATFFVITILIIFLFLTIIDKSSINRLGENTIHLLNNILNTKITISYSSTIFALCTLFFISPFITTLSIYYSYRKHYIAIDKRRILDIQLVFWAITWLLFCIFNVIFIFIGKINNIYIVNSYLYIFGLLWYIYSIIGELILIRQEINSHSTNEHLGTITIPIIQKTLIFTANHSKIPIIYFSVYTSILIVLGLLILLLK